MKNFELFLKDIHIGSITETNWDMRSSGDINYHFNYLNPSDRLAEFIRLSIRYSECLESGTEEELEEISKEEKQFMELINSQDWFILNKNKEKTKILCPVFHEGNEITWQIDVEKLPQVPSNG